MMEQTLVLNASYEPLKIVDWQRAVTLWLGGKAEVVEEHDRVVRAVTFSFKLPSVVRLLHMVKLRKRPIVQFTRANIYARDEFTCQYCVTRFEPEDLTFDHVIPQARGGRRGWDNIVTCCVPCNKRKGSRTPEEAGMTLLRHPHRPAILAPTVKLTLGFRTPESWRNWLYWNVALDQS
jgi:5-methylcytosine-specific restriction endonuclease McrA